MYFHTIHGVLKARILICHSLPQWITFCQHFHHKESWMPKKWCSWTVVTLESPFYYKEIQPVHPKGDQSWIFIGRTDAKAETPILWPPDAKNWLTGKDPEAGKDWRQEEKGTTEDERVDIITDSMDMDLSKLLELMMDRKSWHAVFHGVKKSWSRLSNWTDLNVQYPVSCNWWPFFVVLILFLYVVLGVTKLTSEVTIKSRNILNTKTKILLWCLE